MARATSSTPRCARRTRGWPAASCSSPGRDHAGGRRLPHRLGLPDLAQAGARRGDPRPARRQRGRRRPDVGAHAARAAAAPARSHPKAPTVQPRPDAHRQPRPDVPTVRGAGGGRVMQPTLTERARARPPDSAGDGGRGPAREAVPPIAATRRGARHRRCPRGGRSRDGAPPEPTRRDDTCAGRARSRRRSGDGAATR